MATFPACIVERNLQGVFAFVPSFPNGERVRPVRMHPNLYIVGIGNWILVDGSEEDGKLKYVKKIDSEDFETFRIPHTFIVGAAVNVISFFTNIQRTHQNQVVVYINDLEDTGTVDMESFPSIKTNEQHYLGIFEFPRAADRSESSNQCDQWKLIRVLKTSPTLEEEQRMTRMVAKIRCEATETLSESRDPVIEKPRPFKSGSQNVPPARDSKPRRIENSKEASESSEEVLKPTVQGL